MLKIRNVILALGMLMSPMAASAAQVSIGIGFPHVSIGINFPIYPRLVRIPEYPVYYAPELEANFFFYDGLYWVFHNDNWYASSWYNGPWSFVRPDDIPVFILRVPVRYYRHPPRTSAGGGRMHRHVGKITGAMTGNGAITIGTNGTAAPRRGLPRCLPTSGSIQGNSIPDKWSGSMSFSRNDTVTSHVSPRCDSTIRSWARAGIGIGIGIANIKSG